jgi:tetratricopeptide (TPR) repeat protein/transcriptional regulator with XRE-family HTH domain
MNRPQATHSTSVLRLERIRRNWRQQDLAEHLGTTIATVKRWEQGSQLPGPYFRVKLCDLFGKSAEDLGLIPDEPSISPSISEDAAPFCLPFLRNPYFTGREHLLAHLHDLLTRQPTRAALTQAYSVHGLGGIGKTQLAVEYAYHYRSSYRAVLWMQAETQASIMASFGQMATALRVMQPTEAHDPHIVAAVLAWLNTHAGWLLICDNVEDLSLVKPFLPASDQGALLFTSRLPSLGNLARPLALPPLTTGEGAGFLLARTSHEQDATHDAQEQEAAHAIAEVMGGLPLALEQAGAYIQATQCHLTDYLRLFQQAPDHLLDTHEPGHDHPLSVRRTFLLAFVQVAQRHPVAADLLTVCAFLAPEAIPESVFLQGAASLGLEGLNSHPLAFEEAIKHLLTYSLIQRNASAHTITVHRLVQAVLLAQLSQSDRQLWQRRVVEAMEHLFPVNYKTQQDYLTLGEQLLPHAQTCLALTGDGDIISVRLQIHVAAYLVHRGRYSEAEAIYGQAIQQEERLLGPEHPLNAEALLGLARLFQEQGNYPQAEPLYEQAVSISEQAFGPDHPETATSLVGLGILYRKQGKYQQAIACFERAVQIVEQALGTDHPQVVTPLNGLGIILMHQGKYQQSAQYLERAVRIVAQAFGPEHPQVAASLSNLGTLYLDQGDYQQAAPYLEQVLRILEQSLGPDHPRVAGALHNLGALYFEQGNYQQATHYLERALDIWEQVLDAENADTAATLSGMGDISTHQGHYKLAETYYGRALHIWEHISGRDHLSVAYALSGLANLSMAQGHYEQAEVSLQRALSIRQQHLIPQHPELAETLHDLAHLRYLQGRVIEAISLYQQALAIREQVYSPAHPKTQDTQEALQRLMQEMQQAQDI